MDPETKEMWKLAGRFSAVGIEMGLCVVFGYLIGGFLDRLLGTEPYMLYFWLFAGVGAAFKAVWDAYRIAKKKASEEESPGDSPQ